MSLLQIFGFITIEAILILLTVLSILDETPDEKWEPTYNEVRWE